MGAHFAGAAGAAGDVGVATARKDVAGLSRRCVGNAADFHVAEA